MATEVCCVKGWSLSTLLASCEGQMPKNAFDRPQIAMVRGGGGRGSHHQLQVWLMVELNLQSFFFGGGVGRQVIMAHPQAAAGHLLFGKWSSPTAGDLAMHSVPADQLPSYIWQKLAIPAAVLVDA